VESPLTEDARGILYKFPKLRRLRTVMQGPKLLPQVTLPDLEAIYIQWNSGCEERQSGN